VAVFNEAGQVLLVQRGRPPRQGQWGLPGGLIDLGERLADAARREVWEECGIEVAIGELVTAFEPIERDEEGRVEYHYVVLDYWADHVRGEPVAQDDAAAVQWVDLENLAQLPISATTQDVIRRAHAAWQVR
jgi:ADP-ribose pyrophosphatase YjhB (NUDIX family)